MQQSSLQNLLAGVLVVVLTGCYGTGAMNGGALDGPGQPHLLQTGAHELPRNLPKSRIGNPESYRVFGKQYYVLDSAAGYQATGVASWYGSKFHGRKTSSGEVYDMYSMTAAHRSLPLPTFVEVTNLENGARLTVKVNDRGPFHDDRLIDLSYAAAARLGMLDKGTARVRVTALTVNTEPDPANRADATGQLARLPVPAEDPALRFDDVQVIQVGAFGSRENADALRQRVNRVLEQNAAYIVDDSERRLHKVRFRIANAALLSQLVHRFEDAGLSQLAVITPP